MDMTRTEVLAKLTKTFPSHGQCVDSEGDCQYGPAVGHPGCAVGIFFSDEFAKRLDQARHGDDLEGVLSEPDLHEEIEREYPFILENYELLKAAQTCHDEPFINQEAWDDRWKRFLKPDNIKKFTREWSPPKRRS